MLLVLLVLLVLLFILQDMTNATDARPSKKVRSDATVATPDSAVLTPLAHAKRTLTSHLASLQAQEAALLSRLGSRHLSTLLKLHQKKNQVRKLEDDPTSLPRSTRLKFSLNPSNLVKHTQEYATLKEETDDVLNQIQVSLRLQVFKLLKLEVKTLQKSLLDSFVEAFRLCILKSTLYENDIGEGQVDQICATLISTSHSDLLKYLDTNVASFKEAFTRTHSLQAFPTSIPDNLLFHPIHQAARHDDDDPVLGYEILGLRNPRTRPLPQAPPTPLLCTIRNVKQLILNIFNDPWTSFCTAEKRQVINQQVLRLSTTYFDTNATAEANMIVEQEPAIEPTLLKQIVQKAVDSSTKSLQNELKNLRNQLKQKSSKRGQPSSASSKNKKATPPPQTNTSSRKNNGSAVAAVNDSSAEPSKKNPKTSTSQSGKKSKRPPKKKDK